MAIQESFARVETARPGDLPKPVIWSYFNDGESMIGRITIQCGRRSDRCWYNWNVLNADIGVDTPGTDKPIMFNMIQLSEHLNDPTTSQLSEHYHHILGLITSAYRGPHQTEVIHLVRNKRPHGYPLLQNSQLYRDLIEKARETPPISLPAIHGTSVVSKSSETYGVVAAYMKNKYSVPEHIIIISGNGLIRVTRDNQLHHLEGDLHIVQIQVNRDEAIRDVTSNIVSSQSSGNHLRKVNTEHEVRLFPCSGETVSALRSFVTSSSPYRES